eukprot:maker-scaffold_8-snap-gene-6.11-mRNA-1 protein AED:0.00 eAED:0.00 QI:92/1/1/1/1/1/4/56/241
MSDLFNSFKISNLLLGLNFAFVALDSQAGTNQTGKGYFFQTVPTFIFTMASLLKFKEIESLFGTPKFFKYYFVTSIFSLGVSSFFTQTSINSLFLVSPLTPLLIALIPLNPKSNPLFSSTFGFISIFISLLFTLPRNTFNPCLISFISSFLCLKYLESIPFPQFLLNMFKQSKPDEEISNGYLERMRNREENQGRRGGAVDYSAGVEQLANMGFDRDRALAMLMATNGNVQAAAGRLIDDN